jgi:hypothetical protein
VDDALDALFAGPPDQFVTERDRLAASLRTSGHPDVAAHVKRLRRPTLAAWSLNRVALEQPAVVTELVAASRALRDAHADDPGSLRDAMVRHRNARRAAVDAAIAELGGAGANRDAAASEVATTLDAAALDDTVADALVAGRLERAATPSSAFDVLTPSTRPSPTRRAAPSSARSARRTTESPPQPESREPSAREREREAARDAKILAAAARLDEAARDVDHAQAALEVAEADVRRLANELDAARKVRDAARRRVDRAEQARDRAQAAYDRI